MKIEHLQLGGLKAETSSEPEKFCPVPEAIFTQMMEVCMEGIVKVGTEKFINTNRVKSE
jgi:hypothetical protein